MVAPYKTTTMPRRRRTTGAYTALAIYGCCSLLTGTHAHIRTTSSSSSTCSFVLPTPSRPSSPSSSSSPPTNHHLFMTLGDGGGRRSPLPATPAADDDEQKKKSRIKNMPPSSAAMQTETETEEENFHSPINYVYHDHMRVLQGSAVIVVIVGFIALVGATENFHHAPEMAKLIPPTYSFQKSLLSGAAAGLSRGLSRIITFPLDTIKTRQQAVLTDDDDDDDDEKVGNDKYYNNDAQEKAAEQLVAKAAKIDKGRLFDGLLPMLLIAGPANAAFFVTYDYLGALATVLGFPPKMNWVVELSAALIASIPANVIRIPAEVTKQRVQAGLERKASTAAANILISEGPLGLYVGGGAHLLRELPFNAVQFLTYRNMKEVLLAYQGVAATKDVGAKAVLGAIAAGVASLVTQPLDTIKTGQMLDKSGRGSDESYIDGVKRINGKFGLPGLYLGVTPRFFLCAIGGAFYFFANEWAKSVLLPPK